MGRPRKRPRRRIASKAIARIAAALCLLAIFASSAQAAQPHTQHPQFNQHIDFCLAHEVTAKQVKPFTKKAWRLKAWERGKPPRRVVEAHWQHVRCAAGPGHRKAIRWQWSRSRAAYNRHRKRKLAQRRAARERARYDAALNPPGSAVLETIAACESGGDPTAVSPDGLYRGLLQFDHQTWESVGGTGDPAAASVREQYERGARLYRERGPSPWPNCGV